MRGKETMSKRKLWITALFVLLFAMLAGSAFADNRIDPTRQQMQESLKLKQQMKAAYHRRTETADKQAYDYSYGDISVKISGQKKPRQTLTFKATINGITNDSNVEYRWGISDEKRDSNGYLFYPQHGDLKGKNTISYKFYSAGTYSVHVSASQNGTSLGYWYEEFTIEDDGIHQTLEQKVSQIVKSCKASTNWQTALNLYDWLTMNAYYDSSLDYHGADILFLGYGVCDSFSKAYLLLLQEAGISAERTFGPNHAWNTLKLGGKWYQADSTWDGGKSYPPGQGTGADGSEGHEFFCLSTEIMKQISSHVYEDGTQGGEHCGQCTSMEANYYVHEDFWKSFRSYSGGSYYDQIQSSFSSSQISCEKTIGSSWVYYNDRSGQQQSEYLRTPILEGILKWALKNKADFKIGADSIKTKVQTAVQNGNIIITVKLSGWNIQETGTLTIPKGVKKIQAEAFRYSPATTLVIQSGCTTIDNGAFMNSGIRTVTIPDTVTSIAGNAFSGCGKIIFKTSNPTAINYAQYYGMMVVDP